jgi:geranylgeranyl pyrophosphate synthase
LTPELAAALDARLRGAFGPDVPAGLAEACRYPLAGGGKRIRPRIVFAACGAVGAAQERALNAAAAVELLHTYSLVHDDLPCMDDDDERRGRPTVHRVFGEAVAVLVGDALLTAAFEAVADQPGLVHELARAGGAGGMIAGQYLDIRWDGGDEAALVAVHRAKTGALLRAAARMGGRAGGADGKQLAALDDYGSAIGLAFQVHDDVLDAAEADEPGGPPSFVRLRGLDGAAMRARDLRDEAVAAARRLPEPAELVALANFAVERRH